MKIGIDIVENERIRKLINETYLRHILSDNEINCYRKLGTNESLLYVCGRVAAKEAIIKTIENSKITDMSRIEIINNTDGKPIVFFEKYVIQVSISHERKYTVAVALTSINHF